MDGEYIYMCSKYIEFYLANPHHTSFCQYMTEPSLQQRCRDCAHFKVYYEIDSERNPARAGMKCRYEDIMCDGSDNAGCTYCRMPEEEPMSYIDTQYGWDDIEGY